MIKDRQKRCKFGIFFVRKKKRERFLIAHRRQPQGLYRMNTPDKVKLKWTKILFESPVRTTSREKNSNDKVSKKNKHCGLIGIDSYRLQTTMMPLLEGLCHIHFFFRIGVKSCNRHVRQLELHKWSYTCVGDKHTFDLTIIFTRFRHWQHKQSIISCSLWNDRWYDILNKGYDCHEYEWITGIFFLFGFKLGSPPHNSHHFNCPLSSASILGSPYTLQEVTLRQS